MRKILLSVLIIISSLTGYAQSYDERIAAAMNTGDWFALDSIYNNAPHDSIMPFLEVFSRCLTGNRLNRPDISAEAFGQLFNEHSEMLGLDNLLSSTIMFTTDLGRLGHHDQAAGVAASVLESTRQYLDSAWTESLEQCISRHTALSACKPYRITFTESAGNIPFNIIPVGDDKHGAVLIHLDNSSINGKAADITFDTGAGVNMISDSLAQAYGLIPTEGYTTVAGVGTRKGRYAIAAEMKLGNITVCDVPFVVMDFKTGNAKADSYTDCYSTIIGSELMLQLKDITIDFVRREITIPAVAPERSATAPNMCFGRGMNLSTKGSVMDYPVLMNIDTGDSSYGYLGPSFFEARKDFILSEARPDTVRRGGLGGVVESLCYTIDKGIPVCMGSHTADVSGLYVYTQPSAAAMDFGCNIGLKTLMMFDKIRFNLVDFVFSTYPQNLTLFNSRHYDTPVFKYTKAKEPSILQTLGLIAVEVTKLVLYPTAP